MLRGRPRGRCITLHRRMLFSRLPSMCLRVYYREQARSPLPSSSALRQYYHAVATGADLVMGPYPS